MGQFLAHIRRTADGEILASQTVREHCRKAAEYTARALEPVVLSASGYLAGLVHDAGKFSTSFQDYLLHGVGTRGSVNHTFAGVRLLLHRYHGEGSEAYGNEVSEILAVAAGSHHGLFDCVDERGKNGFWYRLTKENIDFSEDDFFHFCVSREELDRYFQAAREEMALVLEKIRGMTGEDVSDAQYDEETAFYCGLLARLVLSAVIEGDRRDTAEFMTDVIFPEKRNADALKQLWGECQERVEKKLEEFPREAKIDCARREISDQCRRAAERPGGIFRLHVPTGGGKTLASLRYALAHARKYGKQRIIFISPLLSILEQNAAVIREYIQDDSIILEHHSNLIRTEQDPERLDQRELLMETWDAPVILTTLVQLLTALFSGKTAAIRRFHALCGSIIVIDEVQTVPGKMLSMFSLAMNFLSEICGATVVLCSATQPCMERAAHPIHSPIGELVPYSPQIWSVFMRTRWEDKGAMTLEGIGSFARGILEKEESLLIVCNKKNEAEELFHQMEDEEADVFLLSAAMCMAHRRDTLDRLRESLGRKDQKTVCVSTQVIEAGVDISFASVVRLAAGMDSLVQTAGLCNRNGESGPDVLAPVYLVQCLGESLGNLPDIQRGKAATLELLSEFSRNPEKYHSLDSDEAIRCYYHALYGRMPENYMDYKMPDRPFTLFSLLARNEKFESSSEPYYFRQAFRLAGASFEVFDQDTVDVIVPYGKGRELIEELCGGKAKYDMAYLKGLLEQVKPYTVSLFRYQYDRLEKEDGVIPLSGGAAGLAGHYNARTGFSLTEDDLEFLGV